jgi:hypothetical protein
MVTTAVGFTYRRLAACRSSLIRQQLDIWTRRRECFMAIGVSDVRERVEAALEEDERTADYDIEVIDQDGLITLQGEVASAEDKHAAQEIAEAQQGVIDVTNALVVLGDDDRLVGTLDPDVPGEDDDDDVDLIVPTARQPRT